MDSQFYETFRSRVVSEFPGLVAAIGEERAAVELDAALESQNHMLYPEEISEIRQATLGGAVSYLANPNWDVV